MEYHTVYSILDQAAPVPWWHVIIGVVMPIAVLRAWRREPRGVSRWVTLAFMGVCAVFWNALVIPSSWRIYVDHEHAQEHLRTGDCQVIEGTIDQFHPMPYHGHSLESFTVNGVRFSYSDFDISKPGFNHTESHGGPIHTGMRVRIHYRGDSILQVEVPGASS